MGLKGDIDEALSAWKGASKLFKAWIILSAFIASGSIASLSETIVQWKGFILTMIEFYANNFRGPIQEIFQKLLAFNVSKTLSDIIVLNALLIATNIRLAIQFANNNVVLGTGLATSLALLATSVINIWFGREQDDFYGGSLLSLAVMTCLCSWWYLKSKSLAKFYWFIYIASPFVIVGMLAALNAGIKG